MCVLSGHINIFLIGMPVCEASSHVSMTFPA
jgi:hypothetical protein